MGSLHLLKLMPALLVAALSGLGCRTGAQKHESGASTLHVGDAPPQQALRNDALSTTAASSPRHSPKLALQSTPEGAPTAGAEALRIITHTTAGRSDEEPLPWVIALHGLGDRPEAFVDLFDSVSFAAHVYVLQAPLPYGGGFDWFGVRVSGDPVRLSRAMERAAERVVHTIDELGRQAANRGKPAVTGFSQGGMLSYALAVLHPDKIRFAAPVSGWLPPQLWPKQRQQGARVPIVGFHGEADRGVPFDQARLAVEHLLSLGYDVSFHTYPGLGHSMSRSLIADWDSAITTALAAPVSATEAP